MTYYRRAALIHAITVMMCTTTTAFHSPIQFTSSRTLRNTETTPPLYSSPFFASETTNTNDKTPETRTLGSQEHLMLPRQYRPSSKDNPPTFPQMTHVCSVVLDKTPSLSVLKMAIDEAMKSHPFLRSHVRGDGEPEKRIDLFQMVREGEPNPLTFVEGSVGDSSENDSLDYKKFSSKDVLKVISIENKDSLQTSWQERFSYDLDLAEMNVHEGPLWKAELHKFGTSDDKSEEECALVFTLNHAISDQSSVNLLADEIISNMADLEANNNKISNPAIPNAMPRSLEEAVLGKGQNWAGVGIDGISLGTIKYVAGKAAEGFRNPVILPDDFGTNSGNDPGALGALTTISGRAAGGESETSQERRSTLQFRTLPEQVTTALLGKCRANGVTVTNALSAVLTLTATDFIAGGGDTSSNEKKERNYKVLQSLDKRRFGEQPDPCESVGCHAGSMDLMLGPFPDKLGQTLRSSKSEGNTKLFWDLARESKKQTMEFIDSDGPKHAVRVFDFAMTIADLNNLVYLTAQSEASQGRAYSAGITNVGVFERQKAVKRENDVAGERQNLQAKHGRYQIQDIYFATPHARSGCLYQVSCMTVNNELKFTFHPVTPLVSEQTTNDFANAFLDLIEIASGTKQPGASDLSLPVPPMEDSSISSMNPFDALPENTLAGLAALSGVVGVIYHGGAWSQFFQSISEMKQTLGEDNVADFWGAVNFWIFFAVGHPILQPILWISDVLHGSPGPQIADLVPVTFLLGNLAAIAAVAKSKEIRNAVNIAAVSAFITYVGAGLDGQAGMGDFNLQIDDSYQGKIVKGCPAYEDVKQPTMDNFNLEKYQGKWYEQKFHDWTQFKEVYDTTLDIKLTADGKGWIDDFGVKGPAPKAATLSWDKSPVANGAHYFLFGKVDDRDPKGVLRESGFGVEFPNYIVDVQTDPETGEYTEAIQFQCLERGNVRVFEGINFLSRAPTMTDEQLTNMHARAEKAGMNPYGASVDQMHLVERRPVDAPPLDNSWQKMWKAIGLDKLLELLSESIEDGAR